MNKLTEQTPNVGQTIKWQMSKRKTTDLIETHHSNLESSRTIVFCCYWLTTNNITALLTNQGQSLTIYNSLWCSVAVSNSPSHDYTHSCIGVKWLLTIYNKMLTKASAMWGNPDYGIREIFACGIWNPQGFGMRNTAERIRNPSKDWNPIQGSTRKNWNQVPGIRNPRRGIHNPRLSWIPLHETKSSECQKLLFTYLWKAASFHQS